MKKERDVLQMLKERDVSGIKEMLQEKENLEMREKLQERFEELYPERRLLAIQLNGFNHSVFYDYGEAREPIQIGRFSHCDSHQAILQVEKALFFDVYNYQYQGNAVEYVYIAPNER